MKFPLPLCCSDIKGVKSENKFEAHIKKILELDGYQVERQVPIIIPEAKIIIDLQVRIRDKLSYIEVKYNNFGMTMVRAVGQVKWYEFITGEEIYLAFPCYDFIQLNKKEIHFLITEEINIVIIRHDKALFVRSNDIKATKKGFCENTDNFRGYREVELQGGSMKY